MGDVTRENVYELHACVCVLDSAPKVYPRQEREGKTARRRDVYENTHAVAAAVAVSVLLLLLLERIRNVVVVTSLRRVRIRFVYELLSGGIL